MSASIIDRKSVQQPLRYWLILILLAGLAGFTLSTGLTLLAAPHPAGDPPPPRQAIDSILWAASTCGDGKCDQNELLNCPADCVTSGGNDGSTTLEPPSVTEPPNVTEPPPPNETDPPPPNETQPPPPDDPVCGNGICEEGESTTNCAVDCLTTIATVPPALCGDGVCDPTESIDSCPADCSSSGEVCGNGVCEAREKETGSCLVDCPISVGPVCGNEICEASESWETCPKDCPYEGPICGDGVCEDAERDTCREDCLSSEPTRTPAGGDDGDDGSHDSSDEPTAEPDRDEPAVTSTAESEDEEATAAAPTPTDTPEAAALEEDQGPGCRLIAYDDLHPDVQAAFSAFDAEYDPVGEVWLVCERMPDEVCLPAEDVEADTGGDLRIINCSVRGDCSAHPIRSLEDGQACGRAGRLRRLTCLDGCTLVEGRLPISVTGTVIPVSLVLIVLGSSTGMTFLAFSRRGRELEEEFDDIFHLDESLTTREMSAPAPDDDDPYGTIPLEATEAGGDQQD